ncbi:MAG: hypothetical protein LH615_01675, partial [Ferruginibacter sp.]|nr:hypothetical protein [Ferruginibacter sp.]
MSRNLLKFICCIFFIPLNVFAQTDAYPGTWRMEYLPAEATSPVKMELQIATSEKNTLYPAHLKLEYGNFKANYQLLLVKKNIWQLGISKNKYAVNEEPFALGDWTILLNGILEYNKDHKGVPSLTINRLQSKPAPNTIPDTINFEKTYRNTALKLKNFLKDAPIRLGKINNTPWQEEKQHSVLIPSLSPVYFGLTDTIFIKNRYATFSLAGTKKPGYDIVSVVLNGRVIIDQVALNKKKYSEEIMLDTGVNIISLFADNYGSALPNKGILNVECDNKKFALDFTKKADSAATFITAKVYCVVDKTNNPNFQSSIGGFGEEGLQKNEKVIGSIVATSQQITLALWDDATEDGDSISIKIDGRWIVQG